MSQVSVTRASLEKSVIGVRQTITSLVKLAARSAGVALLEVLGMSRAALWTRVTAPARRMWKGNSKS